MESSNEIDTIIQQPVLTKIDLETQAMKYAVIGKLYDLPESEKHDPLLRDNEGRTVAMIHAEYNHPMTYLPYHWIHAADISDNYGSTVAMRVVKRGTISLLP